MSIDMNALARVGARTRLAELVAEMDALLDAFPDLGKAPARPGQGATEPVGRKMSAATRAKMRAAWARRKAGGSAAPGANPAAPVAAPRKKPKMSAAGRAAIVAAQKKRWAAVRTAKKP